MFLGEECRRDRLIECGKSVTGNGRLRIAACRDAKQPVCKGKSFVSSVSGLDGNDRPVRTCRLKTGNSRKSIGCGVELQKSLKHCPVLHEVRSETRHIECCGRGFSRSSRLIGRSGSLESFGRKKNSAQFRKSLRGIGHMTGMKSKEVLIIPTLRVNQEFFTTPRSTKTSPDTPAAPPPSRISYAWRSLSRRPNTRVLPLRPLTSARCR
jgi:hypothetical protein